MLNKPNKINMKTQINEKKIITNKDSCKALKKFNLLYPGVISSNELSVIYYKLLSDCAKGK